MDNPDKRWYRIRDEYVREVRRALGAVKHPRKKEIIQDVTEHLEQRYEKLTQEQCTIEVFKAIIADMGPASDYVELLTEAGTSVYKKGGLQAKRWWAWGLLVLGMTLILTFGLLYKPRIMDKIDYPFVTDANVVGYWKSVDFVEDINDFSLVYRNWQGDLYLKELRFFPNGKTNWAWTWTQGLLLHSGDKTASKYVIKNLDGNTYLFMEWKSGDYTIRHQKPSYYVLKKVQ